MKSVDVEVESYQPRFVNKADRELEERAKALPEVLAAWKRVERAHAVIRRAERAYRPLWAAYQNVLQAGVERLRAVESGETTNGGA